MAIDANSLITTVGYLSSNSYVTLEEFADYRDLNRINADAFDNATADNKVRALIMAARRLSRLNWRGGKVSGNQALSWPRIEVPVRDSSLDGISLYGTMSESRYTGGFYGDYYESTIIPEIIKNAQCELAIAYLEGFEQSEGHQIKSFSADGVRIDYATSSKGGALPATVQQMISGLLTGERLVRG